MGRNREDALDEVIKAARLRMKLTREQYAEMIDLSPRRIMAIENEDKTPLFETLVRMIRVLGVDANAIFYPETAKPDTLVGQLTRLLPQCGERELRAITALVQTWLTDKETGQS